MTSDKALESMSKAELVDTVKYLETKLCAFEYQDLRSELINGKEKLQSAISCVGVHLVRKEWNSLKVLADNLREYAAQIYNFLEKEKEHGHSDAES